MNVIPARKSGYARHWLLVAAAAVAAAGTWVFRSGPTAAQPPARSSRPGADWFLAVRVPLQGDKGERRRLELARLGDWLDSLRDAGFTPVLLSEARARLSRGERLPGKPVVLVLEPGRRASVEAAAPFLRERGVPALWLVDAAAVARRDERYVSAHDLGRLRAAPLADVGELGASTRTFTLGGEALSWTDDAAAPLNRGGAGPLRRLSAGVAWTGRHLAARLQAEVPPSGSSRLAAASLFGRRWGVALDPGKTSAPFDLDAPFDAKSASVGWNGTAATRDLRLEVEAAAVVGELWVYLRYEPSSGRGLRVGFTPEAIVAEEWSGGAARAVGRVDRTFAQGAPLRATIRLRDGRLCVISSGAAASFPLGAGVPARGSILLQAYDRIRGVAGARGLRLTLTPS